MASRASAPRLKLLLDEMWPRWVATSLRELGHDAASVLDRPDLVGRPDAVILDAGRVEGRAVVTENVVDFRPLARFALDRGESHAGLVFTSNRRWPRHRRATFGRLVDALDALVLELPHERALADREHWL